MVESSLCQVRLHALSAASALCHALAHSEAYSVIIDSTEADAATKSDADTLFRLLNACLLVGGAASATQTDKCIAGFMENFSPLVPALLQNAKQVLHACMAMPLPVPLCTQSVAAQSNCATMDTVSCRLWHHRYSDSRFSNQLVALLLRCSAYPCGWSDAKFS